MKRIDLDERKIIQDLLDHSTEINDIAAILKRSASAISTEIKKNGGIRHYNAEEAQKMSDFRAQEGNKDKNSPIQHLAIRVTNLEADLERLKRLLQGAGFENN